MLKVRYLGHACFTASEGTHTVIIDPFLTGNPRAPVAADQIQVDAVLVTHGHGDHLGDAVPIAKRCGAVIVAPYELATYCEKQGAQVYAMHIGGAHTFPWGWVKLTDARHGSAVMEEPPVYTGNPCGFVLRMGGKTVYHAGDTGLFGDMALVGKQGIDCALLPIGDNYTMGIDDAVEAVKLVQPELVVPMHYGTMELIATDVRLFEDKVLSETNATCKTLKPGEELEL